MDRIFIYWDNSNIFHEAQRLAEERNGTPGARHLARVHVDNLMKLAVADRRVESAVVAGSIPPEVRSLWTRLEDAGVSVRLFDRGGRDRPEQQVPDLMLQKQMMTDVVRYLDDPGIVVLLSGDGAGYSEGEGFHAALELMHARGWRVEVLSWVHSCGSRLRLWTEEHGIIVPLDKWYDSITFREPSRPGYEFAPPRDAQPVDLSQRERFA